ncbi:hypothetical protein SAMN05216389_106140 [Oceanobacillus limi]|uniref:Lipoprotein n=1 Tax=Oceanobacillus limi TaxID=930131 RepID=A0A1I0CBH7_9BACI|nr:DUF6612 family protein [Oceanobacillus limi]SET16868.1 hypothetical protein SAMN05216389_106140 [Oceanobacillus limi]
MKKWIISFALMTLAIGLVACGSESAEEVYTNAMEAAEEMESAEFVMEMNQQMGLPEDGEMSIESEMEGSMIVDPIAMHQKGTISMTMEGEGLGSMPPMDMETETYLVGEEFYMYESTMGQWMKLDNSTLPLDALMAEQPDTKEQLEMLEEYVEELEFEEKDQEYVFHLSADGEGFKELTEEMLEEYMPEELTAELGAVSEVLDNMDIDNLNIEIVIDKETYELIQYNLDMSMVMTIEGEEVSITQQVNSEYKGINTVDTIEVPQDVKDSAVDGM